MRPQLLLSALGVACLLGGCNESENSADQHSSALKLLRKLTTQYEQSAGDCRPLASLVASNSAEPSDPIAQIKHLERRIVAYEEASTSCNSFGPDGIGDHVTGTDDDLASREAVPGDAWKNLDLSDKDIAALKKIRLGGLVLAGAAKSSLPGVVELPRRERDSFGTALLRGLREGGVTIRVGHDTLHGAAYAIDDADERIIGYVKSLPPKGDQFANTYDVNVESAFASASAMVARQVRRDFAYQKQMREKGPLKGISLGGVKLDESLPLPDFFQAAIEEHVINGGGRFGSGPTLAGWLKATLNEEGEIVHLKGDLFGKSGGLLTEYAIQINSACANTGHCGEVLGVGVARGIKEQRQVAFLGSGLPTSGR